MPTTPAIQLSAVTKSYNGKPVVNQLTLQVPCGAIFGFLGPNGAGKSTTIQLMTGLTSPDQGEILILGINLSKDPLAIKPKIGVLPDGLALFEYLTIWDHLELIGNAYSLPPSTVEERGRQLLSLLSPLAPRRADDRMASPPAYLPALHPPPFTPALSTHP